MKDRALIFRGCVIGGAAWLLAISLIEQITKG